MWACWPNAEHKACLWNAWMLVQTATRQVDSSVSLLSCSPLWAQFCVSTQLCLLPHPSAVHCLLQPCRCHFPSRWPLSRPACLQSICVVMQIILMQLIRGQVISTVLSVSGIAAWNDSYPVMWLRWLWLSCVFFFLLPVGMLWRNAFQSVCPNRNTGCLTKF